MLLKRGVFLLQALALGLIEALDAGLARLLLHFSLQGRVEVVLDVVIGAAGEELRDLGPSIAVLEMQIKNFLVLFFRPPVLLDVRVQVVVPALSALLTHAAVQVL